MSEPHNMREGCEQRFKNLEDDMKEVKGCIKNLPVLEELTQQMIEANKNQNTTLSNLDKTLIEVSNTMTNISRDQKAMKVDIEGLQGDIKGLRDERSINIVELAKNNWFKVVIAGYLVWQFLNNTITG